MLTHLSSIHSLGYHAEYGVNAWCRDGVLTKAIEERLYHFILMVQLEVRNLVHCSVEHLVPGKVTAGKAEDTRHNIVLLRYTSRTIKHKYDIMYVELYTHCVYNVHNNR